MSTSWRSLTYPKKGKKHFDKVREQVQNAKIERLEQLLEEQMKER
jgi:hypothetical protein